MSDENIDNEVELHCMGLDEDPKYLRKCYDEVLDELVELKHQPEIEIIKHAAVMADNGWIFIGQNHADCFNKLLNIGLQPYHSANGQGFVTSIGRFVSRDKAGVIAFKAKQIDKETDFLCSEDLWCPTYKAKHVYNEIEGYVKNEG